MRCLEDGTFGGVVRGVRHWRSVELCDLDLVDDLHAVTITVGGRFSVWQVVRSELIPLSIG